MKKYKLVKDLPTFKAGDIFYLSGMGNLLHESEGRGGLQLVYDR